MLLPTRAGLVALFFSIYVILGTCAPTPSASPTRHDELVLNRRNTDYSAQQHSAISSTIGVDPVKNIPTDKRVRTLSSESDRGLARRRVDEMVVLVRRKSIGQKIKDAFHKFGQKIKHGFQKVGHAIKSAAQKVGHFFKETGKKIAKVALKVAAVATKAVSKVIGFIPGVGKAVGKVMEAGSKGLNAASDAIKCKIGGKLGTAMHRMNKGMKVMSYIP